jgi:tetratricopeptide (TPR) repeat protein
MVASDELERALRATLPPDLAPRAPALARLIAEALAHPEAPPAPAPELTPALQALAGRELRAGEALISFGASQLGDVSIGDVAGGDIVRLNLTVAPEAQSVAVGRNIVQIGTLVLPLRLLLALLALLVVGAGAVAFALRGPMTMGGRGTFRIAVADFAIDEGDRPRASAEGSRLSAQVFDTLRQQQSRYVADYPAEVITIWHDSMGWREKGVRIGYIPGATAAEREANARSRLDELEADLLIYGYLDPAGRVTLSFYVSPLLKTESAPGVLAGAYQLGEPARVAGVSLTTRAGALFWLLKGLQYDSLGAPERSLEVLQRGEALLPDWQETGEGKEILYFFQGLAATFSAPDAPDKAAFDERLIYGEERFRRALGVRPEFLRPAVGLGAVAYWRALCLLGNAPVCPPLPADGPARAEALAQAREQADLSLAQYERALTLAPESADTVWAQAAAPIGAGSVFVLRGEIALQQGDRAAADAAYSEAVERIRPAIAAAAGDRRILGQSHLFLGIALWRRGLLAGTADGLPLLQAARSAFAECIAQGGGDDQLLEAEVIALCRAHDQTVATLIAQHEEVDP